MTTKPQETAQQLRQRAEEQFSADESANTATPTPAETEILLYDLRLHQIELEMQVEELRIKQSELDTARARYFELYDLAPMGYLTLNAQGLIYEANLSAAAMLGVTRKMLFKNLMAQFIFHDDQDVYYLHRKRLLETGEVQSWEMRLMRADGSPFWAHLEATLQHNGEYWIVFNDISERRRIEEVHSYLLQMSATPSGEDFFESLARYLAKILGMDYVCIDRLHGDCLAARTLAVYHDGRFEDNVEYTLKDTPCGDVVGKEVCVFPRGVCRLFPEDAALQDLQAESYVGTTLWSFDMKPIGLIAVIGRKELNSSHFAESVLKLVSIRAAGELERRQAEAEKLIIQQQFQQAQKLESLGVLAGGIAHDFNNILAIIMGYCSLTKMDYEKADENIPHIEKAAERAAALCRQMLAYAGKATLSQSQVNMTAVVEEIASMLKATISQNVVINTRLAADIPCITGDASQLRQVAMNLIINASEAIGEEQGVIDVSLARVWVKAGQADKDHNGQIIPPGQYLCLVVTDSGCGMDIETMRRIFEPFYTTKFTGRGLGMSATLGIITAHKGALQLESQPGQGTTFKLYLPVQIGSAGEESEQQAAEAPWKGSGTILLAEDEVQVMLIARTMLQELGFKVIEAKNGLEALDLYKENAADITLVVADMGMPAMNGYEMFRELKMLDPGLPIIVSSGFGDAEVTSRIPREAISGLVSKPYSFDQLRSVLKEVVEGTKKAKE